MFISSRIRSLSSSGMRCSGSSCMGHGISSAVPNICPLSSSFFLAQLYVYSAPSGVPVYASRPFFNILAIVDLAPPTGPWSNMMRFSVP